MTEEQKKTQPARQEGLVQGQKPMQFALENFLRKLKEDQRKQAKGG